MISKQERALLKAAGKSLARVSREVKKFISGWQGGTSTDAASWSLSEDTFVRASFFDGRLHLQIVVADLMMSEIRRGARRPGIRDVEVMALDRLVSNGPAHILERLKRAMTDAVGCAGRHREMIELVKSTDPPAWTLAASGR